MGVEDSVLIYWILQIPNGGFREQCGHFEKALGDLHEVTAIGRKRLSAVIGWAQYRRYVSSQIAHLKSDSSVGLTRLVVVVSGERSGGPGPPAPRRKVRESFGSYRSHQANAPAISIRQYAN